MRSIIDKFTNKFTKKNWPYVYWKLNKIYWFWYLFSAKITKILIILYKIYHKFVWKKIEIISVFLFRIFCITILKAADYFFFLKLHLYDNIFCPIINFIWWHFGFRWFYYSSGYVNHYWWTRFRKNAWEDFPWWLWWWLTDYHYNNLRESWLLFRYNLRKSRRKEIFYMLKYEKFYLGKKKDVLKVCVYIALYIFLSALFIKFIFINILNVQFFLISKRISSFTISSIKYFVLYLKFRWYFFFLKHCNKFNLSKKRSRRKKKTFLKDEYFYDKDNFDYSYFHMIIKSIMKTRNIFMYYKFRKDLIWNFYSKKSRMWFNNLLYNKILYNLIKKPKLHLRRRRWLVYIKNIWIYSINFNSFYFYKAFFFFFTFVYSNVTLFLDTYSDLYLNFIVYLAA